jgi:hypothetical protein
MLQRFIARVATMRRQMRDFLAAVLNSECHDDYRSVGRRKTIEL